jgi:hypothetical protein
LGERLVLALVALMMFVTQDIIKVEPDGPGRWRMTITATDETDPLRLADRLRPRAADLCSVQGYYFDRYTFSLKQRFPEQPGAGKPSDKLTVVQDVVCGASPAAPPEPAPAPVLSEADAEALNPQLEALTAAYFAALDQGRHADSFAMADAAMSGGATLEQWTEREKQFAASTGPVTERQIGRLTWYSNPAGAPFGHYGAVDYVASHTLQQECGYLIWYRPKVGAPFRLTRQEMTLLSPDLSPESRDALRKAHCILL